MKTLIILLALTAGFTCYAEEPAISPEWQVQPESTTTFNTSLPPVEYHRPDPNDWATQRAYDLRAMCAGRRFEDETAHGTGIMDRALGNRVRQNLINNGRDASDGYTSVRRNDGSVYTERNNPCEGVYTPNPDPDGDRTAGTRFGGKPLKGGAEATVTVTW